MKKAKDIKPGDIVFNRGQKFVVKEVRLDERAGWILFIDTEDIWRGPYNPEEYLGVEE
jgi:hypothetical protein